MSVFEEQREQIKRKIIDVAIDLYREKGYDLTSISEITKNVGIAKGTFYNYYQSKLEILLVWSKSVFESMDLSKALNMNNSFQENMSYLIKEMTDKITQEQVLYLTFLKEILKVEQNKDLKNDFNMKALINLVIDHSSDKDLYSNDRNMKVNILSNSLFLEIIDFFSKGNAALDLEKHLLKLVKICIEGIKK